MIMKLWLDDERDPKDPIIQSRFGAIGDETWVKTAEEAVGYIILHRQRIKSISLDHDLGPNSSPGYNVATWIEAQAYLGRLNRITWSVHSMNVVGAKRMIQSLRNADTYWDEQERNVKIGVSTSIPTRTIFDGPKSHKIYDYGEQANTIIKISKGDIQKEITIRRADICRSVCSVDQIINQMITELKLDKPTDIDILQNNLKLICRCR